MCCAALCIISSFKMIWLGKRERERKRERELVALLFLSSLCHVTVFPTVQWVDLRCVIVALPGHTLEFFYLSEVGARGLLN